MSKGVDISLHWPASDCDAVAGAALFKVVLTHLDELAWRLYMHEPESFSINPCASAGAGLTG